MNWKDVKSYLKDYVGKFYTIAESKEIVYIGSDLPDEYTGSNYTYKLKGTLAKAKANATQGLKEMIEIATGKKVRENTKEKHKVDAKYRYKGKYFQIVIDGTGIMSFKERHCKHCLKRTYNKGTEEEKTIYYHYVLEAKLVVGDIVISLDSEFVENEKEDVEKQDCEIRAFYRMAERIKKEYPKASIIISGDALYACEPVIKTCQENKWEYILRLKEDRLKLLGEEIKGLEKAYEKYQKNKLNETITVSKGYEHKDVLKNNGYIYIQKSKIWMKRIKRKDASSEIEKLISYGIKKGQINERN